MTETLKPCPFCGSTDLEEADAVTPGVYCYSCRASGPEAYPDNLEDTAAAAATLWNTRTSEPPKHLTQLKPITPEDLEKIRQCLSEQEIACLECGNTEDTELITTYSQGIPQYSFTVCPKCEDERATQ